MSLTHIVRKVFVPRQKQLERYNDAAIALQHDVLMRLVERGAHTEYGRKMQMNRLATYDDFAKQVPVNSYEELKADIDRMRHGESNVLWPGRVRFFAKSSGTTNDKSKFIPVSREGLHRIHYAGGFDTVALYLRNNPTSKLFDGRGLILGGSFQLQSGRFFGGRPQCYLDRKYQPLSQSRAGAEETNGIVERFRIETRPHSPRMSAQKCHEPLGCAELDAQCFGARNGTFG